ncbi:uncharacterized protein [Aquarana catesbeiana]|uniref:uncharacterized protein n=1 Tax=Aquarana catesbeiana TaxID=8400 RepID=UPI003CC9A0C4
MYFTELTEKEHFVDRHRDELIYRIHLIDPILDGLMIRSLLTSEQCDIIRAEPTPQGKMRRLYSVIRGWSNTDKDILYILLKKYNSLVIRFLEEEELTGKEHFVDRYREELIYRISLIDPILDDLMIRSLLTSEQCDIIRANPTTEEKMRSLYSVIRWRSNTDKDILYILLRKYNPSVIRFLEERGKEHFVDRHRFELIYRIHLIDPILDDLMIRSLLTSEQCDIIRAEPTTQDKMRRLYSVIRGWSNTDKDILYILLKKYNPSVIRFLEERELTGKEHFVDKHWEELIYRIHLIDPILYDLMIRSLLTSEQCDRIRAEQTTREKMRWLYFYIRRWSNTDKDILYILLKKYNSSVIGYLEEEEWTGIRHFVDRHRFELIYRIHLIDPILDDLMTRSLLTSEQCDTIRAEPTTKGKMRRLISYIREWSNTDKHILYNLLKKYNPSVIGYLEEEGKEHFVDRHQRELIQRIHLIDPILDGLMIRSLLTSEQCDTIRAEQTTQEKMRWLYSVIRWRSNTDKDILYILLKKYNPSVIGYLEEEELTEKKHFVDRHREELIYRIHLIDPILDGLMTRSLLTSEQCDIIRAKPTTQERMRRLYSVIGWWSNTDKDILYKLLKKYNSSVIRFLEEVEKEHFVDRYREELIQRIPLIDPILDGLMTRSLLTSEQCDTIRAEPTTKGKMRRLYSVIRGWSNTDKDILYILLKKYNSLVIRFLEEEELTEKEHFVDRYREELIYRIHLIDPILDDLMTWSLLTPEQCDTIRAEPTTEEKMRRLYSVIRRWSNTDKDILYILLRKYNPSVIRFLEEREKKHFVDRHREELIYRIHLIDPILDDLMIRSLLTSEQCDIIRAEQTTQDKMRRLYSVIRWRSNTDKDILYNLLKKYNSLVIRFLEEREKKHFVDRHREELIYRIHLIDPILDDLMIRSLLTSEQCDTIRAEQTTQEKMRWLYSVIRWRSNTDKDILYILLKKYNPSVIGYLEEREKKHFVDRHREELIQRIHLIDPILDGLMIRSLLTSEQCDTIRAEPTPQEKMRRLYFYIRRWSNTDKDILYNIIKKYNFSVIRFLEEREWTGKEHFVDKYRGELIYRIHLIDPILDDLMTRSLLTSVQCDRIRAEPTTREKMRRLYSVIRWRSNTDKDILYILLKKYNPSVIGYLEERVYGISHKPGSSLDVTLVRSKGDGHSGTQSQGSKKQTDIQESGTSVSIPLDESSDQQPGSSKESAFESFADDNPEQSEPSSAFQTEAEQTTAQVSKLCQLECRLCGKAQYDATVVIPEIIKFGRSYRLHIESPGLFRCHSTGIQFLLSAAVMIEYTLESWSNYFPEIQKNGYKIAGPLFNIRTNGESEKILELYLPHHLCLNGITEEDHLIKCAHFVDENMLLETPSKIEPFYMVVEKPVFSLWGAVQWIWGKKTPVHANILMYFRILRMEVPEKREYKIHLYLVIVPFLDEETLNRRKESFHFQRIEKPPQTLQSVFADTDYNIYGGQDVHVLPETLKIDTTYPPVGSLPYTEITFRQNEISLQVLHQDNIVWKAWMSEADIEDLINERHKRLQNKSSNISVHGAKSCQDLLLSTLNDMEDKSFKVFKAYLNDGDIVYPYTPVPCSDLEKADRIDVANLLISHYTNEKAPIVANKILEAISEVHLAKELKSKIELSDF